MEGRVSEGGGGSEKLYNRHPTQFTPATNTYHAFLWAPFRGTVEKFIRLYKGTVTDPMGSSQFCFRDSPIFPGAHTFKEYLIWAASFDILCRYELKKKHFYDLREKHIPSTMVSL